MRLGRYRHDKGGLYDVLFVALHTETNEKMVVYKALTECADLASDYESHPHFVRPYAMFFETADVNGQSVPRFAYVDA